MIHGKETDLSVFPNRRGFTDVIQLANDPKQEVAWTTITFPQEGWMYFAIKNSRVLRQTVMWFSNGGRHSSPWNGTHIDVLGLEEVTAFFGEGLSTSVRSNTRSKRGIPTYIHVHPQHPTSIRYIMGVARVPRGFQKVKNVRFQENEIVFLDGSKKASAKIDWNFVKNS
jgi:hypothetical protein